MKEFKDNNDTSIDKLFGDTFNNLPVDASPSGWDAPSASVWNNIEAARRVESVGGNGNLFDLEDFNRITHLQYEQDLKALRTANKVCFFDTDAVVTAFFSQVFLGSVANRVESFIEPSKYDLVIALKPTVPWVADGMRELGEQGVRDVSFEQLRKLYRQYGFNTDAFVVIAETDYYSRLEHCIAAVDHLLYGKVKTIL